MTFWMFWGLAAIWVSGFVCGLFLPGAIVEANEIIEWAKDYFRKNDED